MNENKPSTRAEGTHSSLPQGGPLKPYLKPAFRHEQVFETMALACGKVGTQGQCKRNQRNS